MLSAPHKIQVHAVQVVLQANRTEQKFQSKSKKMSLYKTSCAAQGLKQHFPKSASSVCPAGGGGKICRLASSCVPSPNRTKVSLGKLEI